MSETEQTGQNAHPTPETHPTAKETTPASLPAENQARAIPKKRGRKPGVGKWVAGSGLPKGYQMAHKKTYEPASLAESVATALVEGKGIGLRSSPRLGPVTEEDRRVLQRITGETVEVFNARVTSKLQSLADSLIDSIQQDVDHGNFKPGEKSFALSVALDKGNAISGRSSLQNASINQTINFFGSPSKESLLDALEGKSPPKQVEPLPA